jgi:hypothetical protein
VCGFWARQIATSRKELDDLVLMLCANLAIDRRPPHQFGEFVLTICSTNFQYNSFKYLMVGQISLDVFTTWMFYYVD